MSVPEIETARLRLRGFAPADVEGFAALRADPEVMRYIGKGRPQTRVEAEGWLDKNVARWRDNGFGMWAVVDRAAGEFVGWCGLARLEEGEEVEVGYGFARGAWGRGFATEGARASLRFGFETCRLERIVAVAIPENAASRRVMEKLGMRYVRRAHHYGVDVAYHAVTRREFPPDDSPYVLHQTPENE